MKITFEVKIIRETNNQSAHFWSGQYVFNAHSVDTLLLKNIINGTIYMLAINVFGSSDTMLLKELVHAQKQT